MWHIRQTLSRVACHTKNWAGVIPEIEAHCRWESLNSGTVADDAEVVGRGAAVHNVSNKRWCVPHHFLSLTGLAFPCTGWLCDDLPGFMGEVDVL